MQVLRHSSAHTLDITYSQAWFQYLNQAGQRLTKTSLILFFREKEKKFQDLPDYAFIVFSLSKAYEGFLKQLLLDLKLIDKKIVENKHFRIGRALNPDIRQSERDEHWLYDDVAKECGEELSRQLWNTWLQCRNQIFHYFPGKDKRVGLSDAEKCLNLLIDSMSGAVGCLKSDHLLEK